MPEYIVKTHNDRNLVIEAEKYNFNATESAYEFFAKDNEGLGLVKVATILYSREILGIVKNKAEKSDHYWVYDWNKEDEKEEENDVCVGCQYADLLGSDSFFEAVSNIIDYYLSSDDQGAENNPAPTEDPEPPKEEYPIEKWKDKDGKIWYGFHTKEGFVNFIHLSGAKSGRESQVKFPNGTWSYLDLTGATKLEENL